jgi:protein involved in temperature-dependent protein secretion
MTSKFTIAVSDSMEVPVKFTLKEGKVNKSFAFTLMATRMEQDDIAERMRESEYKFKEGLLDMGVFTGWTGQRLVLDADGNPAEFSIDALEAMLSVPVVAQICYQAWLKESGAKEKN